MTDFIERIAHYWIIVLLVLISGYIANTLSDAIMIVSGLSIVIFGSVFMRNQSAKEFGISRKQLNEMIACLGLVCMIKGTLHIPLAELCFTGYVLVHDNGHRKYLIQFTKIRFMKMHSVYFPLLFPNMMETNKFYENVCLFNQLPISLNRVTITMR